MEEPIARFPHADFAGAALDKEGVSAWGNVAVRQQISHGKADRVAPGPYSEGGAVTDVDGDGRPDLVLQLAGERPQLVWLHAPDWTRHLIASGIETRDIMAVTLLGHRGVVVVHKQMQVRFYEIPSDLTKPWPAQDLYSFYTPSREGGLGLADIDGDGLPDLLCGNDWIRSPQQFDLHWRLFAINLWNEQENSAMLRFAYSKGLLVAGQREMTPARLAWFEKPEADPTPLWPQHAIEGDWDRIHSVELADFDGDGKPDALVGDSRGIWVLPHITGMRIRISAESAVRAFVTDTNGDGRPDVLLVRRNSIAVLRNETRH